MSTSSKAGPGRWLWVPLLCGLAVPARAGIGLAIGADPLAGTSETRPADDHAGSKPAPPSEPHARARRQGTLRCYQYGHEVYQTPDAQLIDKVVPTMTLSSGPNGQTTIQMFDLRVGLCILESRQL